MFSQVKNGEWLQSIAVGRRQYLGPLLLSMAWVVRSLKERCPFSMSEFLPFERCWMLVWVFMMAHGWLFAQLILCLICTLRAFCWICISIFFTYSLGRFKQEQQCHWAALDASDTHIKSMVAGVQNWQGFPFLKWGSMFLLWTKCSPTVRGFCPKMRWNMSMCSAEIILLYYCTCTVLCLQMLGTMSMFAC